MKYLFILFATILFTIIQVSLIHFNFIFLLVLLGAIILPNTIALVLAFTAGLISLPIFSYWNFFVIIYNNMFLNNFVSKKTFFYQSDDYIFDNGCLLFLFSNIFRQTTKSNRNGNPRINCFYNKIIISTAISVKRFIN
jgi:hypothetical protein